MADNPKSITIYGRLSFPTWTAQEAYDLSQKGTYPAKDIASAQPSFQLVLNDTQWQKFLKHATEVFLPYVVDQHKKGEKRDALDPREVQMLLDGITGPLDQQVYNTPAKPVSDKTLELAPDAVAVVKCIGPKGGNIELKAIVTDESELAVPDPDILQFPVIQPISRTKHQMYAGAYVAATLSCYAYHNGKLPGFSAGVTTAVFKADAPKFGGSVDIDTDEIFLD